MTRLLIPPSTRQIAETTRLLSAVIAEQANFRYAPALRISRNDPAPLPRFEQESHLENGFYNSREFGEILDEFRCVRESSQFLFRGLAPQAWERRGTAGDKEIPVRALAYIRSLGVAAL